MNTTELPFKIGGDYEMWEFDLEIYKIDKIAGYDSYIYNREVSFLELIPEQTELIFSWDILHCVVFNFNFQTLEQLHQYKEILNLNFGKSKTLQNEYMDADIYKIGELEIWLIQIPNSNQIQITFGRNPILHLLYD